MDHAWTSKGRLDQLKKHTEGYQSVTIDHLDIHVKCGHNVTMFSIDTRDIRRMELELQLFTSRAFPIAVRRTLTDSAKAATKFTQLNMRDELTLRNRFTENSMLTSFARGLDVDRMKAVSGSISPYMPIIEFGGKKGAKGSGVPLPTSFSSGEGESKNRTKLPRGKKKLENISLSRKRKRRPKNRKQAVLFAVQDAVTAGAGNRDVFLDLGKTQGIFRVVGGRKGFKRGWPKGARLRMLYDLSRTSVDIPAHPVMTPAFDRAKRLIPLFYEVRLKEQIKREGLFR